MRRNLIRNAWQLLREYYQDHTDWCSNCERVTVWHGERCAACSREWGFDADF